MKINITQKTLLHYDIKILIILLGAVKGNKKYFHFLLDNGYPELAAWSNVMRGDEAALHWLFDHGYNALGMMTLAIDNKQNAIRWVNETKDDFLIYFTAACRKEQNGINWLRDNDLDIFLEMAKEEQEIIKIQQKDQMFWYKWK
ncbi:MAG: hypothetical protein HUK18_05615 [Bacteroidales bacterium]|nr:hypothetical protein [Bacteroidales bacterium]